MNVRFAVPVVPVVVVVVGVVGVVVVVVVVFVYTMLDFVHKFRDQSSIFESQTLFLSFLCP